MTFENHLSVLKQKWNDASKEPGVFQYSLNVVEKKYLPGKYNFRAELNPERITLRRIPYAIPSLFTAFDHNKFNFNKIKPSEKLLDVPFEDSIVSFIINQSPLTIYHSLICPDLEKSQPQLITENALAFCIEFLLSIEENGFRIGYNSPGALASVNHLHLHLIYLDCDIYVDNAELEVIGKSGAHRLSKSMPTEGICYLIDHKNKQSILKAIYGLIQFLCKRNIPHNVFITRDRKYEEKKLKLFVFAREKHFVIKDITQVNAASLEHSGYVTVGDSELYKTMTEEKILDTIKEASGNVYSLIYEYLNEL